MTNSDIDCAEIKRMVESLYEEIQQPWDEREKRLGSKYADAGEREKSLRSTYGSQYERKQLEAALGLLSKEIAEYLSVHPRDDVQVFFNAYSSAINQMHPRNYEGKQVRRPLHETDLHDPQRTKLVVEQAAQNQLSPKYYGKELSHPEIVHEWTTTPGEILTDELAEQFQDIICGDVYDSYREQRFGKVDLPVLISTNVLSDGFTPDSFWVPISVCFSMIIAQRGLDQYCEDRDEN